MTLAFNKQGKERKPLVAFIAQALEAEANYTGVKGGYAYQINEYSVDKNGTVTGPDNRKLADTLETNGFTPESMEFDTTEEAAAITATAEGDSFTIELPLGEFTPAKIENLRRMVEAICR